MKKLRAMRDVVRARLAKHKEGLAISAFASIILGVASQYPKEVSQYLHIGLRIIEATLAKIGVG